MGQLIAFIFFKKKNEELLKLIVQVYIYFFLKSTKHHNFIYEILFS
jgi:hypothetical protein